MSIPTVYRKPLRDALVRAGKTFLQAAIPVTLAVQGGFLEGDVLKAAAVAGGAAVLALIQNSIGQEPPADI